MNARAAALALALTAFLPPLAAQEGGPFHWNSPLPADAPEGVRHGTFRSKANGGVEAGYNILLPPDYDDAANAQRRYPVVYYLHGGRPGGENKSVSLAATIGAELGGGAPPVIYVFVNGGKLSHYDHEGSLGETAFVKELIPHIDKTYRTIARREARGVEGFSQGGRGAARILFKHRDLFVSAAPMGGGHQHEKRIDENAGVESETVRISPAWNNTWELARRYAADKQGKPVRILVVVGTKDFNYEANLEWMAHLTALGIAPERIVVPDTPHSAREVYAKHAAEILRFHAANFHAALGGDW
jgi:enterochelin esterase-like enzyme